MAGLIKASELKKLAPAQDFVKVGQAVLQYMQRVVHVTEEIMKVVGRSNMTPKFIEAALDIVGRPVNSAALRMVEEKPILVRANVKALTKMENTAIGAVSVKLLNQIATTLLQFYMDEKENRVFEDPADVLFTTLPTSCAGLPGFKYDPALPMIPSPYALERVAKKKNERKRPRAESAVAEKIESD